MTDPESRAAFIKIRDLCESQLRGPVKATQYAREHSLTVKNRDAPISDGQIRAVYAICRKKGWEVPENLTCWTKGEASDWITANGG